MLETKKSGGRSTFKQIIKKKMLLGEWKIDLESISLASLSTLDELDFAVLFHCYKNYYDCDKQKCFRSTKLMWDLGMCPTHYKELRGSLIKLTELKYITSCVSAPRKNNRHQIDYSFTKEGRLVVENLLLDKNLCEKRTQNF